MRATWATAVVELIGTSVLVCAAVGSGMLASQLTENDALTLLMNTLSVAAILGLLILMLSPISGAHFNPAVSLAALIRRDLTAGRFALFATAQLLGATLGTVTANLMFRHAAFEIASKSRADEGSLLGEVIATAGLIVVIFVLAQRGQARFAPIAVGLWIGSASLFTASTSFANPAVTFGRMFTNSFAGISPDSVLPFMAAQFIGMFVGLSIAFGLAAAERLHAATEVK